MKSALVLALNTNLLSVKHLPVKCSKTPGYWKATKNIVPMDKKMLLEDEIISRPL